MGACALVPLCVRIGGYARDAGGVEEAHRSRGRWGAASLYEGAVWVYADLIVATGETGRLVTSCHCCRFTQPTSSTRLRMLVRENLLRQLSLAVGHAAIDHSKRRVPGSLRLAAGVKHLSSRNAAFMLVRCSCMANASRGLWS